MEGSEEMTGNTRRWAVPQHPLPSDFMSYALTEALYCRVPGERSTQQLPLRPHVISCLHVDRLSIRTRGGYSKTAKNELAIGFLSIVCRLSLISRLFMGFLPFHYATTALRHHPSLHALLCYTFLPV